MILACFIALGVISFLQLIIYLSLQGQLNEAKKEAAIESRWAKEQTERVKAKQADLDRCWQIITRRDSYIIKLHELIFTLLDGD